MTLVYRTGLWCSVSMNESDSNMYIVVVHQLVGRMFTFEGQLLLSGLLRVQDVM
jgi:hypothetical protein